MRPRVRVIPFLLLSLSCLSPAVRSEETVVLFPDSVAQTIEGWGGHVYPQGYAFLSTDTSLMRKMLVELRTTHMRVRSIWYELEAANDNDDPTRIDTAAIARGDTGLVHQELLFQQELSQRGVKLLFASWRFPYWMIGKPARWRPTPEERPPLPSGMEEEYVESLCAYLLYARDRYGIVFDAVSVANEPDIGIYIDGLDPARLLRLTRMLRSRLEANGYLTRYYLPDAAAADSISADYVHRFFAEPGAAGATCAVSYHSYRRQLDHIASFAALATTFRLPVWVTEQNDTHLAAPDRHLWSHALKNAVCLQELLVVGRASLSVHFSFVMASSGGLGIYQPEHARWTPTYTMLKHFQNHIPPGSRRIATEPFLTPSGVLASAFLRDDGRIVCLLVNPGSAPSTVHLKLPGERVALEQVRLSTAGRAYEHLEATQALVLPPESVATAVLGRHE